MTRASVAGLLVVGGLWGGAAMQAQPAAGVTAIRGGTVFTITRGVIEQGVVVLRDGRITAVGGPDTAIPPGSDVVDASGRFVTPDGSAR